MSFESVFCMKTVISWLATYQWKKIIENFNSVGAGAHEVGKSS